MNLMFRLGEKRDLIGCRELLREEPPFRPEVCARLPELWAEMMDAGTLNATVLEDWDRPPGARLVQFGMTVFVTQDYMHFARTGAARPLSADPLDRIIAGHSPVLSLPEAAQATAGDGLNMITLHNGFPMRPWSEEQAPYVINRVPESFFWGHAGYRLREILLELTNETFVRFTVQAGFVLATAGRSFAGDGNRVFYLALYRTWGPGAP